MKRGRKPKTEPADEYQGLATKSKKSRAKIQETIIKFKDDRKFGNIPVNLILHLPISSVEPQNHFNKEASKNIDDTQLEDNVLCFNKPRDSPLDSQIKPANKNMLGFRFIKTEEWAKSTDIKCWWDSYNFDNVPCSIPFNYVNTKFEVFGCFCSFNCALAYIINSNIDKKDEKISLLHLLYRKIYNKNDNFEPAPKKEILLDYGGNLTIEQYRNMSFCKQITQDIVLPPIVGVKAQIDTRNIQESLKHMKRKSIISTASLDTNINVILKRESPLNSNNDFMSHFIKS